MWITLLKITLIKMGTTKIINLVIMRQTTNIIIKPLIMIEVMKIKTTKLSIIIITIMMKIMDFKILIKIIK
jgi:hypothetical protein